MEENSDDQQDVYTQYFNPNDLSNWIGKEPEKFLLHLASSLNDIAGHMDFFAGLILKNPDIKGKDIHVSNTLTLEDILQDTRNHIALLRRLAVTAIRYREAYQRGELNEDQQPDL